METRIVFDLECNGFLDTVDRVWCLAWCDLADGVVHSVGGQTDHEIRAILPMLERADYLIGHNIIEFDLRVLKKIYPEFNPKGKAWDTLLDSKVLWTEIRDMDFKTRRKNPDFPAAMIGRHSLKAWGYRLGILKGELAEHGFEQWSQGLQDYCEQDVRVTVALYNTIVNSTRFSQQAHDLEMELKDYMLDQETEGMPFDEDAAKALYAELASERANLEVVLATAFAPWDETKVFVPKRDNKTRGYLAGVPFNKTKTVTFNPRSHKHIADRLIAVRGWQPEVFTETGQPETDYETLVALGKEWPECKTLARHAEIQKVIGMVAEGKTAYLKVVKDGRIHGRVDTCGTGTGRCSHKEPNLANIPRVGDLGKRVRALFKAPAGYELVGSDAKGLELRMLGHFLARFDGGAYAKIVVEGDPHTYHQGLAGLASRDQAKTFIYGFIYGAGPEKIGLIVGKGQAAGQTLKNRFLRQFPALAKLKSAVGAKVVVHGAIRGIDGRYLHIRSSHAALNTLLQSAGAIAMKMAVIYFNRAIREKGWFQRGLVKQVVFCHDELQSLSIPSLSEEVKEVCIESIRRAGAHFNLRCSLDGEGKVGPSWLETH